MSLDIIEIIAKRCDFISGECIIEKVWIDRETERLLLTMRNGRTLVIRDNGQSCCEHRHMTCDDDLTHFQGAALISVEEREVIDQNEGYEVTDICFLIVNTSMGSFTVANMNQHNGYYGGFVLECGWLE